MKKLLVTTSILASLITSSAFAKTEGNYAGFDLLRSSSKVKSNSNAVDDAANSQYYSHNKSDSAIGFGINYKHAFNYNDFFVAPGVFIENLGNESKASYSTNSSDGYNQSLKLNNRYGLRADFGYDITNKFSAYIPVGFNYVSYEMKTNDYSGSSYISSKKTGRESGYFYGLGLSYAVTENVSLNAEYNKLSELKIKSPAGATFNDGTIVAKTNLQVMKVGVSYHF